MTMTPEKKKALYKRFTSPAFYLALLGAVKLMTDAFGAKIISDEQVNAVANGAATIFATIGIFWGYESNSEQ